MIIASVSTIPGRIDGLLRVLSSLPQQTKRPDLLLITVSDYYPRMKMHYPQADIDRIETFVNDEAFSIQTKIVRPSVDIGPVVKLTTAIAYMQEHGLTERADDHQVFIFDDDSVPYPRAIELLQATHLRHTHEQPPLAVYGMMGANEHDLEHRPKFLHGEFIQHTDFMPVDILGGYRGVLYPSKTLFQAGDAIGLMDWVEPFVRTHTDEGMIAMHDDHIFSYYCAYRGFPLRVIRLEGANGRLFYEPIDNKDGIFNDATSEKSYQLLHRVLREVYHMNP